MSDSTRNGNLVIPRGPRQRVVDFFRRLERPLHLHDWFPHIPLALLVACLGLLQLIPRALRLPGADLLASLHLLIAKPALLAANLGVAPGLLIGGCLLVMALALAFRSRFAWSVVLFLTAVSLVISLLSGTQSIDALFIYNAVVFVLLFFSRDAFSRSSLASGTLFALTSIVTLMAYGVLGSYELGGQFDPPIRDLVSGLYFAVVTMSTVGYGDITPQTPEAKLFVVSLIVLGITLFAAAISAVLIPIINNRVSRLLRISEGSMEREDHYVIVGATALALNVYKELTTRGQRVTFIWSRMFEEQANSEYDVVIGDSSNLDVLRRAGADQARAILALGGEDADNAFVVLAMKDLADGITTVAAVNSSKNLPSMKRVSPDLIISPDVLGGELLAMALSGEEMDQRRVLARLLHFREQ